MPRIFDNIELPLLPALQEMLAPSRRSDFCVGYFNLQGWAHLAGSVDAFEGTDNSCCRVLVGMHRPPDEVMRESQRAIRAEQELDKAAKIPTTFRTFLCPSPLCQILNFATWERGISKTLTVTAQCS